MKHIEYFKKQAKNLFKDYKTKHPYPDNEGLYAYNPKFFDIDGLLLSYDWDKDHFTLMNAQHIIANMAGFNKWGALIHASEEHLDFAHLLFDNEDKANHDEWEMYLLHVDINNIENDYITQKEIFQHVFIDGGIISDFTPYNLKCETRRNQTSSTKETSNG